MRISIYVLCFAALICDGSTFASQTNDLFWGYTHLHGPYPQDIHQMSNAVPLDFLVITDSGKLTSLLPTPLHKMLYQNTWLAVLETAERYNQPGRFTTFIGWESGPPAKGTGLHRIVFIKEGKEMGKRFFPATLSSADGPEVLWQWLDKTATQTGADFISVPHYSDIHGSGTLLDMDNHGKPVSLQYAKSRLRWEPIAAVTPKQLDTHSQLVPPARNQPAEIFQSALLQGLALENKLGTNPYKPGLSGYDTATADTQGTVGATAVWAKENTRKEIFDALRRREVYSTTGPRINVRFFAGWDFFPADARSKEIPRIGYKKGVPMGGDLSSAPSGKSSSFLIQAIKDPKGENLDQIQIIKGWIDKEGKAHDTVYDVPKSGHRKFRKNPMAPPGSSTKRDQIEFTDKTGVPRMQAVWIDPDFDPTQRAFYYARVLQIPTPDRDTESSATIQHRAFTSPIWYTP